MMLLFGKGCLNLLKYCLNLRQLSKGKDKGENNRLFAILDIGYDCCKLILEIVKSCSLITETVPIHFKDKWDSSPSNH